MTMLHTESLHLALGEFVLEDVTLSCAAGECLALLGPSGSGKTTCVEIMAGLRRPDSGRVWINDRDVTGSAPERRDISYLSQDVTLFPHLSVRRNILFPAHVRSLKPDEDRLHRLCEMLEIEHLLDRRDPNSLSGGEAQRVALARALLVPPLVLFLDECFGSLDTPLRRQLAWQFRTMREATKTTTVMVTHDTEEACIMADRLAILHRGVMRQVGTPAELHRRPATVEVARFLGMQNILPVRLCQRHADGWRCDIGGIELLLPTADVNDPMPAHVGFFTHDVELAAAEGGTPRDDLVSLGTLFVVESLPVRHALTLRLSLPHNPGLLIEAEWRGEQARAVRRGEAFEVRLPASRLRWW